MPLVLLIAFLCLVLIIANRAQTNMGMRTVLYALLLLINAGIVLLYGFDTSFRVSTTAPPIQTTNGLLSIAVSVLFAGLATALLFEPVRRRIARLFPKAAEGGFDPASIPQMTAMIYCVYLLASTVLQYISAGGLSGLAQDFSAPTAGEIVAQLLIFVLVAVFGAGLLARRTLDQVIARLGLRWPTVPELMIAALVSFVLIIFAFSTGVVWELLTPPDVLQQQTQVSQLLSESVSTLTLAMIASVGAAIGEEVAFRGALQPVFGLWPTAIFFALTHIQYTLTPATLLIIGVAIGFGWLRRRYNTTTAIVAHFLYDFTLFSLPIYARYLQDVVGISATK